MTKIIKETKNYTLQAIEKSESDPGKYVISNKEYNVDEFESTILPQAIKFLSDMQAAYDALSDIEQEASAKSRILPIHAKGLN